MTAPGAGSCHEAMGQPGMQPPPPFPDLCLLRGRRDGETAPSLQNGNLCPWARGSYPCGWGGGDCQVPPPRRERPRGVVRPKLKVCSTCCVRAGDADGAPRAGGRRWGWISVRNHCHRHSRGSGCASPPALGTALGTTVGTCHHSELELQGDGSRRDPPSPHFLPGAPHRDLRGDGGGAMPAPSSLRPRPRGAGSCPGCSRRAGQGAAPRECGWERPAGTHPPARPPAPCGTAAAPGPLRAPKPSPWDGEGGEGGALAVVSPHLL